MKKLLLFMVFSLTVCALLFTGCDFKEGDTLSTKGTTEVTETDRTPETTTGEEQSTTEPTPGGDSTTEPTPGGDNTTEPTPGGDNTTEPTPGGDNTTEPTPGGDSTTEPSTDNELDNAGANTEGGYGELIRP